MKPKLKDGYKWGASLTWSDVKVGDRFDFTGSRAHGAAGGKIVKINRVTFVYEIIYMNDKPMQIKTRKDDFYGGGFYISRGKVVHKLTD